MIVVGLFRLVLQTMISDLLTGLQFDLSFYRPGFAPELPAVGRIPRRRTRRLPGGFFIWYGARQNPIAARSEIEKSESPISAHLGFVIARYVICRSGFRRNQMQTDSRR